MRRRWLGILCVFIVAFGWEALAHTGWISARLFPSLTDILVTLVAANQSGELPRALACTLGRMFAGFISAVFCAAPLGIWLGRSERAEAFFLPTVEFLRSIPPAMLILPAMLFLGIGSSMKIFVVFFACLFPLLINIMDSAATIPILFLDTARTIGVKSPQMIREVIVPASLPGIFSGLKTALPMAFIVSIVVEMIGDDGIGHYILKAQRTFEVREMFAGILQIAFTGLFLDFVIRRLENKYLKWYKGWKNQSY